MIHLSTRHESWPIRGSFTISRGTKTSAEVVTVTVNDGANRGRGECVPYARYGESIDSVIGLIEGLRPDIESGLDRESLQTALPAGAARNAIDCALWDLEAKRAGKSIWQLLHVAEPAHGLTTAYTLSLDTPGNMCKAAIANAGRPLLKLKLGGVGDVERVRAVREGSPNAELIIDANEAWDTEFYASIIPQLIDLNVVMIEQPFKTRDDDILASIERPITICADESCHDSGSLDALVGKYDMINIKLDKTGGLTEALRLKDLAASENMQVMVGCMLATSLAMAPAIVVGQGASIVDLDGPLLLEADRDDGLVYENSKILPLSTKLWG